MGKHKKFIYGLLAGWFLSLVFSPTHVTSMFSSKPGA